MSFELRVCLKYVKLELVLCHGYRGLYLCVYQCILMYTNKRIIMHFINLYLFCKEKTTKDI